MFEIIARNPRYAFEPLPDAPDFSTMSPDELTEFESGLVAQFAALRPTASTPEDLASLTAMASQLTSVRAVIAEHAERQVPPEDLAAQLAALDAQVGTPAADPPEGGTPPAGEGEATVTALAISNPVDPEAIAAAAARGASDAFATGRLGSSRRFETDRRPRRVLAASPLSDRAR